VKLKTQSEYTEEDKMLQ